MGRKGKRKVTSSCRHPPMTKMKNPMALADELLWRIEENTNARDVCKAGMGPPSGT